MFSAFIVSKPESQIRLCLPSRGLLIYSKNRHASSSSSLESSLEPHRRLPTHQSIMSCRI
ncbi:hypothetical protein Hanom_Chr08g00756831 [Helianthus anomalus]